MSKEEMKDKLDILEEKFGKKEEKKKPLSWLQNLQDIPDEDIHKVFRQAMGEELDQWMFATQHIGLMGVSGKQMIINHDGQIFVPLGVNVFKLVKHLLSLGYDIEP